jgi:hypothetical protein
VDLGPSPGRGRGLLRAEHEALTRVQGRVRVAEHGESKYYVTNHAETATLKQLAPAIKARWSCE